MSGASPGRGIPITFRCVKCRRGAFHQEGSERQRGTLSRLRLTGATRPCNRPSLGVDRATDTERGYRCLDCGHVGWSRHSDLVRYVASHGSMVMSFSRKGKE